MEVPKPVSKIGDSWVIKLDKDTRKMLGIKEVGEVCIIRKKEVVDLDVPGEAEQPAE